MGESYRALSERILARTRLQDHTVLDDLAFLAAWDQGLASGLSSALRIRQLRRANPVVPADGAGPAMEVPTGMPTPDGGLQTPTP